MPCHFRRDRLIWFLKLLLPIIISIPFLFQIIELDPSHPRASPCLGILLLTALFWVFEPIPIVISSFIPIVLQPLFHVTNAKSVANQMWSDTSIVFLSGFIFSSAMVRWNLHSRIALKTVLIFGLRPWLLLLGMMLVTTFLGMWISNTACALTMLPNALAIITKMEEMTSPEAVSAFAKCLFLAIPFCCSVGGFSTLIGTPPNLILAQLSRERFPNAPEIGFAQFMFVAAPISFSLVILMYVYFFFVFLRKLTIPDISREVFEKSYRNLGPMKPGEKVVGLLFILLACLWMFRGDLAFGKNSALVGWSNRLYDDGSVYISDGTAALLLAVLLFIFRVPPLSTREQRRVDASSIEIEISRRLDWNFQAPINQGEMIDFSSDEGEDLDSELQEERTEHMEEEEIQIVADSWIPILEWKYAQDKIPWDILFLFSGGFVLNAGFQDSGMDIWMGGAMGGWTDLPFFALVLIIALVATLVGAVASNTACANILLPIVAVIAQNSETINPWRLMFPICFVTSCCFLLPVSTPPNLIAYGYGRFTMRDMLAHGAVFTVISLFVVIGMCELLMPAVFDTDVFPKWAER